MKVIILAAGKGTRLNPLTLNTPKPLIEVGNKKIIDRIMDSLPLEIDEIIVVIDHLKEKIQSHLEQQSRKIIFVEQSDKKGTFGALLSAKDLIKENERFLVLNADDINDREELEEYLKYPRSMGIQKMIMPNYYSVKIDGDYIDSFSPQTGEEKTSGAMIATGVYVLDANIFKHPGVVVFGGELGLPQTIMAQKNEYPIKAVVTEKWVPINSFAELENANRLFG